MDGLTPRLSAAERAALRKALSGEEYSAVYLFGSRADAARRGGDVDILIHSTAAPFALAHRVASRYAAAMDARLDVLVIDPRNPTAEQAAFLALIASSLVPLNEID